MQKRLDTALKSQYVQYEKKKGKSAPLGINAMHHHTCLSLSPTLRAANDWTFYLLKIPNGRVMATSKLGTLTISAIFKSAATLARMYASLGVSPLVETSH
jgi:hypothetical protein